MTSMELNKPGYYKVLLVEETDFDPDAYGNKFYSIVFEGDAQSHLWKTKTKPDINTTHYGHFELSRSGKAQIFKKDVAPEDAPTLIPPASSAGSTPASKPNSDNKYLRDVTALPLDVYRVRANIDGLPTNASDRSIFFENIKEDANELLRLIEEVRNGS